MRIQFRLTELQPFAFTVEGNTYAYGGLKRLALKRNLDANIEESVLETPAGKKIWLTVVGDDDQVSAFGIHRGWYVAKVLPDDSAAVLIKAFEPWAGQ
jgi:hypothetical protein